MEGMDVKTTNKTHLLLAGVAVTVLSLVLSPTLAISQSIGEPGRDSGEANPLKNIYFGE